MSNRYVWNRYDISYYVNTDGQLRTNEYQIFNGKAGAAVYADLYRNLSVDNSGQITGELYDTVRQDSLQMPPSISLSNGTVFRTYILYSGEKIYYSYGSHYKRAVYGTLISRTGVSSSEEDYARVDISRYREVVTSPQKSGLNGTLSNASSSTYPPRDNREKISVICVIPPVNERRVCNV